MNDSIMIIFGVAPIVVKIPRGCNKLYFEEWCKKVAAMNDSSYTWEVKLIFLFIMLIANGSEAAQRTDYWYKVESPEPPPEEKPDLPEAQFDSIEARATTRAHNSAIFWTRKAKLSLGTGTKFDKGYLDDRHDELAVIAADFSFRDLGWHRLSLGGVLTFHTNFMVHFLWQFTPSRKQRRVFYGFGLGLNWDPRKEFRTLIEPANYQLVGAVGYEWLLTGHRGLRAELRGFGATEDRGLMILAHYIWHL